MATKTAKKPGRKKASQPINYAWSYQPPGCRVPAQTVGDEIAAIRKRHGDEGIDEAIVKTVQATGSRHPLHACFEWNDRDAAHKHRCEQARQMRVHVRIVRVERPGGPKVLIPAFVSPRLPGQQVSLPIDDAMGDDDTAARVVDANVQQLRYWVNRCRHLERLSGLASRIAALLSDFEKNLNGDTP